MPTTDSAGPPVPLAPPAPTATMVPDPTPARSTAGGPDAPLRLERAAAELESIADHWTATRTTTAVELARARTALAEAQVALRLLAESR